MIRIAAGEPLGYSQQQVTRKGASIECRIYAEDPTGFLPSPGTITRLRTPSGPWVRDDGGFYEGAVVPPNYDPLISKLSVWAPDRKAALARMRRALGEYVITGIKSNLTFHEKLLAHPDFAAGHYHTGFITEHSKDLLGYHDVPKDQQALLAAAIALAASRLERRTAQSEGNEAQAAAGLSPWVATHRQKLLG